MQFCRYGPSLLRAEFIRDDLVMGRGGRYKVRKEPSSAKRCEKSGKDAKRAVLWKKNRLCYIELDFDRTDVIKINVSELQILV